jgi:hypothetical protein
VPEQSLQMDHVSQQAVLSKHRFWTFSRFSFCPPSPFHISKRIVLWSAFDNLFRESADTYVCTYRAMSIEARVKWALWRALKLSAGQGVSALWMKAGIWTQWSGLLIFIYRESRHDTVLSRGGYHLQYRYNISIRVQNLHAKVFSRSQLQGPLRRGAGRR